MTLDAIKKAEIEIPIQGKNYVVVSCEVRQEDLQFYIANPRIYTALHSGNGTPRQDDIEGHLQKMEHVRVLRDDIKKNGGLLEPVLVKESTREVVEGNSRLAAYRLLAKIDPVKWGRIRALVLPMVVNDSDISSILSQLHLKGKLNWSPYEQAGHIHRRYTVDKVSLTDLCKEVKLSNPTVRHRIKVITYMIKHNDNNLAHWSHYDQILGSKKIQKAFENHVDLEPKIVSDIKNDRIKAVDIRDKLNPICVTKSDKPVKMVLDGKSLDSAFESAQSLGGDNNALQKLVKLREYVTNTETKKAVAQANPKIKSQLQWELTQIRTAISKLLKSAKPSASK